MFKKLKITILLCFISLFAFSQQAYKEKFKKGEVQLESGETIPAYIYHSFTDIDLIQNAVRYISPEKYEVWMAGGKVKNKDFIKLKPKQVNYYKLDEGPKFVTVTYADLTSAGFGAIPTKFFLEEISAGKISMYKKYQGGGVFVDTGDAEREEKFISSMTANYELLILKEEKEKNVKNIATINLIDYISDAPTVLEDFNADKYGRLKSVFSSKIKSAINHPEYMEDFLKLLEDYNI